MKYFAVFIICFFGFTNLIGQVSVTTDLPAEVAKNKEYLVNITFNKGPIKNYSKYEMNVPSGIVIKDVDCKYGAFSFENDKLRIIWAITPAEPIYTIKVNFFTGNQVGVRQITQTYAYAEKGQKLELDMAKINFTIVDTLNILAPVTADSNTDSTAITSNETKPEDITKEVTDLKNDSKEAEEIGNVEKLNAELKIAEAKEAMQKADSIQDPVAKKEALEAANLSKRKAEEELAAADRILVLSKSLNENANEIEKLNQPIDSIIKVDNSKITTASVSVETSTISNKPAMKMDKAKETAMDKGARDAKDLYNSYKPEDHHEDVEIEQQVSQLRMDSKDALEVGTREKLKAEQSLHDAYDHLKKAKYIPDAEEKKLAIEKANADIDQAKSDLEIASKILTLSKSLEENAKEIERLHLNDPPKNTSAPTSTLAAVQPNTASVSAGAEIKTETKETPIVAAKTEDKVKETVVEKKEETSVAVTTTKVEENTNEKQPEEKKESPKVEENVGVEKTVVANEVKAEEKKAPEKVVTKPVEIAKVKKETKPESKEVNNSQFAFTLQLGSFVNSPDMSKFKQLGKVELKNESGKYKVYYGKFVSKQEASEMRQKTVAKGYDCFVVSLNK